MGQLCRTKAEHINSKNAIFAQLVSMESREQDECDYCGGLQTYTYLVIILRPEQVDCINSTIVTFVSCT